MFSSVSSIHRIAQSFTLGLLIALGLYGSLIIGVNATNEGLVGFWKLNESTGTEATDSSGQSNAGLLVNFSCTTLDCNATSGWSSTGQFSNSLNFDGSDDSLNAGSAASLDDLQNFTFSAWIYPRTLGEGSSAIIMTKAGGFGYKILRLADNVGQNFRAEIEHSGSTGIANSAVNTVSLNQWQHVALTYSSTTKQLVIYKNGVSIATATAGGTVTPDAAGNLLIGNNAAGSATFNGRIDDTRVYNRALSATEIAGIYDGTNDDIAPVISNVGSGSTTTTATITWNTDLAADSQVEYGTTASYGSTGALSTSLVTSHSRTITGLTSSTLYHFRVRSRDTFGNLTVSGDYTFRTPEADSTDPVVTLTAPSNGATVSGSTVITASASDNVGVAGVQFKLDGSNLGSEDTSSPFTVTWDTCAASNGSHTLSAVARDAQGNTATASTITVTVSNAAAPASKSGALLLENFASLRSNGEGADNLWIPYTGEDPGQTGSVSCGSYRAVSGPPNQGIYLTFIPRGTSAYAYPGGYAQSYIRSGEGSWPSVNRMRFWVKPGSTVSRRSDGGDITQVGTYSRGHSIADTADKGRHFYHLLNPNYYSNRWMLVEINSRPQHEVGGNASFQWSSNPTAPTVDYFDGLTAFYFDTQNGVSSFSNSTWLFDNFEFDTVASEPDNHVASVTGTYTGTGYELSWFSRKDETVSYEVRYGTGSLKCLGFNAGTSGGTVASNGTVYGGVLWQSPTMTERNALYMAIKPSGTGSFTQIMLPQPGRSSDTSRPVVALSGISGGSTLSGATTLTALGCDDTWVRGLKFKLDGQDIGSEITTGGTQRTYTFSWDTTGVSNGTHTLTAVARDTAGNYGTGATITITVDNSSDAVSTTASLTSSLNPSTFGSGVTLTAMVSPGTATGTVTFKNGSATIGTASLGQGSGSITISSLRAGTHSLTAVYAGNSGHLTSTSPALSQTVSKANSAVSLASSLNPSTFGSGVTLTATVSPSSATGTVTFYDGAASLGTASVGQGSGRLIMSALRAGTHSLTAVYSGNSNYNAATSPALMPG